MKTLAFDTCLDKMYVTLGMNGKTIDSKIIETTEEHYHSAFLISTIRGILKNNSLTPQDIDNIATNVGPGSFTGIRACTTVARVFSQSSNDKIKTIGVSSLEILARLNENAQTQTLVALDARKNMAYVAIFDGKKQILAPKTMLLDEIKQILASNKYFVVTDNKLQSAFGGISYQNTGKDLGKFLLDIAEEKINQDAETNWRKLQPLYIQPPPVTCK